MRHRATNPYRFVIQTRQIISSVSLPILAAEVTPEFFRFNWSIRLQSLPRTLRYQYLTLPRNYTQEYTPTEKNYF